MLGISLYPEKAEFKEIKEYLSLAKSYGFTKVFLSLLQVDVENLQVSIEKYKKIIAEAKEQGYRVAVDFLPQLFELLGETYKDLKFLSDLGVDIIRLDAGMSGKEEALMTKNPYGIQIELNMSNYSHYLEQILDYSPKRSHLIGCHNFFPQKYTGLSTEQFRKYSEKFRSNNIFTAAFVTSQVGEYGPWEVQEGLCTLEKHRFLPIEVQVRDILQSGLVDDILIGTMFASEEELKKVSEIVKNTDKSIVVEIMKETTDFEKNILFDYIHNYRADSSDYMIRSTRIRAKISSKKLPPHPTSAAIKRGDVLILNEKYGQYKGEVQIALKDRPQDDRVNIVARIPATHLLLIETINRFEDFYFKEEDL